MPRKPLYMQFIDNRLQRWLSQGCVAFPVVQTCIDDDTFHRRGGIVTYLMRRFTRVVSRNSDSATIWVEQDLRRIKE